MTLPNETQSIEWRRDGYVMSTDRALLDFEWVYTTLSQKSYWARDLERPQLRRAVNGSIVVGIYQEGSQIGFARVVTDCTQMAYLMDVFIDEGHRGHGLGTWIASAVREHPDLSTVSRWLLSTADAHGVYARAGWVPVANPQWMMEVRVGQPVKTNMIEMGSQE